jgi:CubicO group peptidase (beta-lactamase class C family)
MKKAQLAVILACTVAFCLAQGAVAQEIDEEMAAKIHALFALVDVPGSPGASLAVARDGEIIYSNGYGYANLEYDIPIMPSTIFHVASVSKQFTAFAVALLADQGKLSLDDDIHKFVPELPDFGKTITLKHLIFHTSGIRDQWELLAIAGWRLDDVITTEHILKMLEHQQELNFDPGAEHTYSNSGYTLLAEVVARVTGQSFREWTRENMFKPLGMTNTHFHDDHEMIVPNRAYSYSKDEDGGFKKSVLSYANVGATSLFTTAEDLTKWAHNFAEPKVGGTAVIEQMLELGVLNNGTTLDYAFGLFVSEHKGQKTVGHSGGDAGFRSHIVMFPEHELSVVVLSNFGGFAPSAKALQVAEVFLADVMPAGEAEAAKKTVEVDPEVFEKYVGKYALETLGVLEILIEEDRLMVLVIGQGQFELMPTSETEYFLEVAPVTVAFNVEDDGSVNSFAFNMGGQDVTGHRIQPPTLTADELAAFVGDYFSEELGTTYSIVIEDGELVAKHRRHPDSALVQTDVDRFSGENWWFSNLEFARDDEGSITGFKLTGGRVRNLRFDKVE